MQTDQDRPLFSEEHRIYREAIRRFLADTVPDNIEAWRGAGCLPRSFLRQCGEQGLLCPQVPEAYGGPGGDFLLNVVVAEETAYAGLSQATFQRPLGHRRRIPAVAGRRAAESDLASWHGER